MTNDTKRRTYCDDPFTAGDPRMPDDADATPRASAAPGSKRRDAASANTGHRRRGSDPADPVESPLRTSRRGRTALLACTCVLAAAAALLFVPNEYGISNYDRIRFAFARARLERTIRAYSPHTRDAQDGQNQRSSAGAPSRRQAVSDEIEARQSQALKDYISRTSTGDDQTDASAGADASKQFSSAIYHEKVGLSDLGIDSRAIARWTLSDMRPGDITSYCTSRGEGTVPTTWTGSAYCEVELPDAPSVLRELAQYVDDLCWERSPGGGKDADASVLTSQDLAGVRSKLDELEKGAETRRASAALSFTSSNEADGTKVRVTMTPDSQKELLDACFGIYGTDDQTES